MTTVSLKMSDALLRDVEHEAATRGVPKSAVIRESLEQTLVRRHKKANCLDLMGDAVGHFSGPADLSANKAYLTGAIVARSPGSRKNHR